MQDADDHDAGSESASDTWPGAVPGDASDDTDVDSVGVGYGRWELDDVASDSSHDEALDGDRVSNSGRPPLVGPAGAPSGTSDRPGKRGRNASYDDGVEETKGNG